jgi:hypothetical protein
LSVCPVGRGVQGHMWQWHWFVVFIMTHQLLKLVTVLHFPHQWLEFPV